MSLSISLHLKIPTGTTFDHPDLAEAITSFLDGVKSLKLGPEICVDYDIANATVTLSASE